MVAMLLFVEWADRLSFESFKIITNKKTNAMGTTIN